MVVAVAVMVTEAAMVVVVEVTAAVLTSSVCARGRH